MIGHTRERAPGRWQHKVYVGRDPLTGKERYAYRTVNAGGQREAERDLARFVTELGVDGPTTRATFGELLDRYVALTAHTWSPGTEKEHLRIIRTNLAPLRKVELAKLRTDTLDEFYVALTARGGRCRHRPCPRRPCPDHGPRCARKGCTRPACDAHVGACSAWTPCDERPCEHGGPLDPATVVRIHVVVHSALERGVKWGWIARNPAEHAEPGEAVDEEIDPPTDLAVVHLLETAETRDPDMAAYLLLAADTGARRGAMCAIRWTHLDLVAGSARFPNVIVLGTSGLVERPASRTKKSGRHVAINAYTVVALQAHRDRMVERAQAVGVELDPGGFVFSNDPDMRRPLRPDSTTRRIGQLMRAAGTPMRLHDLRHFMATTLLAAGVDPKTIAQRGGWRRAATMLDRYAHALAVSDRTAADIMGGVLGRGTASG